MGTEIVRQRVLDSKIIKKKGFDTNLIEAYFMDKSYFKIAQQIALEN
jgi:hypothetical protein